jgi:redox-sensitive bicupin YhaK (pirin superfamily)
MIETVIVPRARDLGDGFEVRRALPSAQRRMVGPFIFFDQMGPAILTPGRGLDVRPHPHIGLATVTYLFEGELLHRDSLGTVRVIRPGELNWMTAGGGIVHSERTPPEARQAESRLFGIQSWVALPARDEECPPAFAHHGAGELPVLEGEGVRMRLIAGALLGARSPVRTAWETFYADVELSPGARLTLPPEHDERAVYVVRGDVEAEGAAHGPGQLLVLRAGGPVDLAAPAGARIMALGGATMDGPRHIWWNFVSSSPERMHEAAARWREGRFPPVPGEHEFIPLPEAGPPPVVRYP